VEQKVKIERDGRGSYYVFLEESDGVYLARGGLAEAEARALARASERIIKRGGAVLLCGEDGQTLSIPRGVEENAKESPRKQRTLKALQKAAPQRDT
jgi:hypothetical protein